MKKVIVLLVVYCFCCLQLLQAQHKKTTAPVSDRQLWLAYLDKLAQPILTNLANNTLKEKMPVVLSGNTDNAVSRKQVSYLEAFGRLMCGIAPWLNSEGGNAEEMALRTKYRNLAVKALANAVDPAAADYLRFNSGQPLVDASFLAFALVRCPWLWEHTDSTVHNRVVAAFKITRSTMPGYNNWILFSGMIEAFFCQYNMEYDALRIEYGIRELTEHWYVGDGVFSDGRQYHWDYYNSFVMQPYLSAIVDIVNRKNKSYATLLPRLDKITKRYAVLQERMINTDGSYPVTGRSICYRGGAFHHLADMALKGQLPEALHPAQVRSALTAVIKKTTESPLTFTKEGWLNIGLYGSQPDLAEGYINTGSCYLASFILLPLGLPETDPFWSAPAEPWTSVKVWSGQNLPADHAID